MIGRRADPSTAERATRSLARLLPRCTKFIRWGEAADEPATSMHHPSDELDWSPTRPWMVAAEVTRRIKRLNGSWLQCASKPSTSILPAKISSLAFARKGKRQAREQAAIVAHQRFANPRNLRLAVRKMKIAASDDALNHFRFENISSVTSHVELEVVHIEFAVVQIDVTDGNISSPGS